MKREQTLNPGLRWTRMRRRFASRICAHLAAARLNGGRSLRAMVDSITVDDIVHIIQEEASEDVLFLSGAGEGDINQPLLEKLFEPGALADRQSLEPRSSRRRSSGCSRARSRRWSCLPR